MSKKYLYLIPLIVLLISALGGCQPSEEAMQATETQIAAKIYSTLTAAVPTHTPTPDYTPTPTRSPSPVPTATAVPLGKTLQNNLILREGPATQYKQITFLKKDQTLTILGQYAACAWYKVITPEGQTGWIKSGSYFQVANACTSLLHATFRPFNGALILDKRGRLGGGQLKVNNGLTDDALVVLTDSNARPFVAFYVYGEAQFTLLGVPDGVYRVLFMNGKDWDGDEKRFMLPNSQFRFENMLDYETTTAFRVWSISLQPEPGGTTNPAIPINPDEIPPLK
jgi:uncharacterized protein YgiM (DUF1202 family)